MASGRRVAAGSRVLATSHPSRGTACVLMSRKGRLIVVCGLPGSGKTTYARKLETEDGAVRYCPDEWMTDLGANLWDEQLREQVEGEKGARAAFSIGGDCCDWGREGCGNKRFAFCRTRSLRACAGGGCVVVWSP